MSVPQIGTPRTKFFVPSIGSITHCRLPGPAAASLAPNSSPSTPSRGRVRASVARSAFSTAVSASDTGVRSGLLAHVQVLRAEAGHRDGVRGVREQMGEGEIVGVTGHSRNLADLGCPVGADHRPGQSLGAPLAVPASRFPSW